MSRSNKRHHKQRSSNANLKSPSSIEDECLRIYNEGLLLEQDGKLGLAESAYRRAISIYPTFPGSHNNLGNVLSGANKWKAAEKAYRKALDLAPDNAMLLSNISNAQMHQDKLEEAVATAREAIRIDHEYALAYNNLGNAQVRLDRDKEAIKNFQQAARLEPGVAEIAFNLGAALLWEERFEEASSALQRGLQLDPHSITGLLHFSRAQYGLGRKSDARHALQTALELDAWSDVAYALLAKILYDEKRLLHAEEVLRKAIALSPNNGEYYNDLGITLREMGRGIESEAMHLKAASMEPKNARFRSSLGTILKRNGKKPAAMDAQRKAIQLQPDYASAYRLLAYAGNCVISKREQDSMESMLQDDSISSDDKAQLCFAFGKTFSDLGQNGKSVDYYMKGNGLKYELNPYNLQDHIERYNRIISTFDADFISKWEGIGHNSNVPIFNLGLSRAGKSVLERLIGLHPEILSGGENGELGMLVSDTAKKFPSRKYPDSIPSFHEKQFTDIGRGYVEYFEKSLSLPEVKRVTNTLPWNAELLGMIRICLPNAKIIYCRRDAKDQCVEMYRKYYGTGWQFTYDLAALGTVYQHFNHMMEHWQQLFPDAIHTVHFEDLVQDPERELRQVIDFCGLAWEDMNLEPIQNSEKRKEWIPPADKTIDVWRPYEKQLAPLFEILGEG